MFILGVPLGFLSGFLMLQGYWYLSIIIMFLILLFLKQLITSLGIRFPKRASHRFFMGAELVLTWLVFWIIFLNPPPLHLVSGPQVSTLQEMESGKFVNLTATSSNHYSVDTQSVDLRMYVYYVKPISSVSVSYYIEGGNPSQVNTVSSTYTQPWVYFNLSGTVGQVDVVTVRAVGSNGIVGSDTFYLSF
ncbi:hypothetical protein [Thermogymnomonas acidicola]|uniref:hypothetical protein n=1 Tax=Thermogymnomonas acidicola TaxID=399579 RepID=UPI0013969CFA|nr:hypothetical protein [Thermogymnomonas acidicola]